MGVSVMGKKLYRIMIVVLVCIPLIGTAGFGAQTGRQTPPPIEWTKTFGSPKIDYGYCVRQTADRGFIITGAYSRNAYSPWCGYIYLVKTDPNGNMIWNKTSGITNNENVGKSVQPTTDGGYIVAGYTGYTYHIDGYLEKTDSEGSVVWSHTYGNFDYYDAFTDVLPTGDGYLMCGCTGSYGAGGGDMWLVRVDLNGVELWNKTFGGPKFDGANSIYWTQDCCFLLCGTTQSYDTNGDAWVVKVDYDGNELWNNIYGGSGSDEAYDIQEIGIGDGVLAIGIVGTTSSYGAGNGDIWFIFADADYGWEEMNLTFGAGQYDVGYSFQQTSDRGFFITGQYTNPATQNPDLYVIKLTNGGYLDWQQIVDNNGKEDVGNYGIETSDGGYIVTGNTGVYQLESTDVWLVKFQGSNDPPNEPSDPFPANNSVDQDLNVNLSWTGGDPNDDPVVYDVFFGNIATPPLIAENITQTSYNPGPLVYNTTYYWKIRATDAYGATTEGPLWCFTTRRQTPTLEIGTISGGIGKVNARLKNNGTGAASNVAWSITVTGGMFHFINENASDTVTALGTGQETSVASGMFFGLGSISITVSVRCDEVPIPVVKEATGKIILFWVTIAS